MHAEFRQPGAYLARRRDIRLGWSLSIVRSQSRNGSHKTLAAERPAVIPTWPAFGSTSVILGSKRASARAESGGTM